MIMEWFSQRRLFSATSERREAQSLARCSKERCCCRGDSRGGDGPADRGRLRREGRGGAHNGWALPPLARLAKGLWNGLGEWQQGRQGRRLCNMRE
jgi:hypothetical protein